MNKGLFEVVKSIMEVERKMLRFDILIICGILVVQFVSPFVGETEI